MVWGEKSKIAVNPRSKNIHGDLQAFFPSITIKQPFYNSISVHLQGVIGRQNHFLSYQR